MTITTNDDRDEYTATSGQTTFNYTFKIYNSTDLNVYQTPSGQDFDDLADITTAYTVTGVGSSSGGTVVLNSGAANGDRITIVSDIPSSRTTDYQVSGDFIPATVNDDVDRAISLQKQAEGIARRALLFPQAQQGTASLTLPNPISGKFMKWKSDLSGLENHTFSAVGIQTDVSVDNYASLRALDSSLYSDGQVVFVTNDGIAGQFVVKTGTVTDNAGTLIVFTDDSNRYAERVVTDGVISVDMFGAVGASPTVDTAAFKAAALEIARIDGGTFLVPPNTTSYDLEEDIQLPDNTIVIMNQFARRTSTAVRSFDSMFVPIPGATNVRFERMLLDCNNVPGITGVILRRNNVGSSCGHVYVKNAAVDATIGGGRGLLLEDGVTGAEPKLCSCDTLVVEDSFNGLGFNGGTGLSSDDKTNHTNIVGKVICNNVEAPIAFYGNNLYYPHSGNEMSLVVDSFAGFNCGKFTSAQPAASTIGGIVSGIRASNCKINSFYLYNTPSYTSGATIYFWEGEYKNIHIVNAVIDSELNVIVRDGADAISFTDNVTTTSGAATVTMTDTHDVEVGYSISGTGIPGSTTVLSVDSNTQITMSANATASATVTGTFAGTSVCKDSTFQVQVNRDVSTDLFQSSITGAGHLVNNRYDFSIDKITTNRMVPSTINNQTSNFLRIQSKEHNCHVWGKTGTGGVTNGFSLSTFSGYCGQLGGVAMSDTNGQPHELTVSTSNQLLVDGTYANLMQSYTVATLPSSATFSRTLIYVSDETGGATPAFSDGSNWRRVSDLAIVS